MECHAFFSYCIEHSIGNAPAFDCVVFSFNRDSLNTAIDKAKQDNTEQVWWEYTNVLELRCPDETLNKLKVELKNNNCGYLTTPRNDLILFKI